MADKLTQIAAGYLPSGPFRCDHCIWFNRPDGCALVEGVIEPAGCCNGWESEKDQNTYRFGSGRVFKTRIKSLEDLVG